MARPIHVGIISRPDCVNLTMRYQDAVTGKWTSTNRYTDPRTGEVTMTGNDRKFATKLAILWERDLNSGLDQGHNATTWQQFRERYEDEVVPGLAERTGDKITTVFRTVERILPRVRDGRLSDLTPEALSRFQAVLRDGQRSENTIAGYLAHLRAALTWACEQGMIFAAPKIRKPQRAKKGGSGHKGKGRAISGEEFDRMLSSVPAALSQWNHRRREAARKTARNKGLKEHQTQTDSIPVEVNPDAIASWVHYLTGLWLSGLRLRESLEVFWNRDDRLSIETGGKRLMLRIPAELEKGHRDRLLPVTPDFGAFLSLTEEPDRHGPIFFPTMPSGHRANAERAGHLISLVGELARVVVHTDARSGKTKFASAHDLRRSFGNRWARRVTTPVLMKLMRHESIQTTMAYYVDLDADELAEDLYRDYGPVGSITTPATNSIPR